MGPGISMYCEHPAPNGRMAAALTADSCLAMRSNVRADDTLHACATKLSYWAQSVLPDSRYSGMQCAREQMCLPMLSSAVMSP